MARPDIEVADIFRAHGPAFRRARAGHLSLGQLKVMSAIERCRSGALGGHALRCAERGHLDIAYNSCRNRHCPKCQGAAARHWLAKRQAELLPVEYFHVVFTVPSELANLAFHNPALVYDLMFRAAADTVLTIGADPKHLGAHLGITAVLHTWGSALTHHPHLHCIIPAGGIALDGQHWQRCRPGFFLPVRVLSRLFRRRLLQALDRAWRDGQVKCFGDLRALTEPGAFTRFLARLRKTEWVVYAKAPFAGPGAVLAYLARYTHRVAISNARLLAFDADGVTFRVKDYRAEPARRYKAMTLASDEFIRRFLIHVLPKGLHRIRHYGLFANARRARNLARARQLLQAPTPPADDAPDDDRVDFWLRCPGCGHAMTIVAVIAPPHWRHILPPSARAPP